MLNDDQNGACNIFDQPRSALNNFSPDFELMPGANANANALSAIPSKNPFNAPPIANSDRP